MTRIFAASAYVAVMSLAIAGEAASRTPQRATGALAKGDCAESGCARRGAGDVAALARTGPNETTATRSGAR